MTATLYTCKACKITYIGNGRTRFCVKCGGPLVNQGERLGGLDRAELNRLIHAGWCVFMAKMEGD